MGHVHVVPYDETRGHSLTFSEPVYYDTALAAAIKKIPHVAAVSPFAVDAGYRAGARTDGRAAP